SVMFRRLPGDETRTLVSTTPDTAVVFRPAVVRTPAIISVIIWVWRLLAGLARAVWRHPIATAVPVTFGVIGIVYGYRQAIAVFGVVLTSAVSWALLDPDSFRAVIGRRLLAWWRLVWIYRRHWQPVMIISGLGKHLHGRDYLPRLLRVTCDDWSDRVTVAMLAGQAVTDWTDRVDHLAHGFGAASCRISTLRPGRLMLTFPRRDPLAIPRPAVPIPPKAEGGPLG